LKGKSDAAKKVREFLKVACLWNFLLLLSPAFWRVSQALKGFFSELKAEILVLDSWTQGCNVSFASARASHF
jgi:hypothetical protein